MDNKQLAKGLLFTFSPIRYFIVFYQPDENLLPVHILFTLSYMKIANQPAVICTLLVSDVG